ncbi:MAG TPA: hypothetical protein GXX26_12320 [Clostridiaceae bacterium]|nr:hypothetical protein [Clostridiaceae bacterium]
MADKSVPECPCVRKSCPRFGKCDECTRHHLTHKRYPLPYCRRESRRRSKKDPSAT